MNVLVVVPTYNERDTLASVVARILAADSVSLLIVDDASPDGTGSLAEGLAERESRVHVLHRSGKLGLGSAYRTGFQWGMDRGFDVLCEMDADLSHNPSDLPRLLSALENGADAAIGSRYVPGGRVQGWSRNREQLSRVGNRYVRAVTGVPVQDATAGFRAYRRRVLEDVEVASLQSEGYSFQLELTLRAWQAGFRFAEVPITFTERQHGVSKISRAIVIEALWRVLRWGWEIRLRPRRRALGARLADLLQRQVTVPGQGP